MESLGSNPQVGANSGNPSDSCSISGSQVIPTDPYHNSSLGDPSIGDSFAARQSDVSFTPGYNTSPAHYIVDGSDPHAVPYASGQQNSPANAGHNIVGGSDPHTVPSTSEQQYPPANAGHYILGSSDPNAIPYTFKQQYLSANAGHHIVGGSDPHAVLYASEQQNPPGNAGHYVVGDSDPHAIPYASEQQHAQANAGHSVPGSSTSLLDSHGSLASPSISSHRAIAVRMPSWTPNDSPAYGVTGQNLIPFLSSGSEEGLPIALSDILLHNFHKFLETTLERSNIEADPLFALMETFIVDYGGEYKVMGCLAVTTANEDNILCHDYVLSSVSQSETEPTSWLTTQSLGSLFRSERQKRGVWALTQLPDAHLKSLTQQWTFLKLK
jgi:hypothetical protein